MGAVRQLRRKLAEVPDVALVVLPVPVQGVLYQDAVFEDLVADFDRLHAVDRACVVRDGDDVDDRRLLVKSPVGEARPRNHRKVLIVDRRRLAEVARVEAWAGGRRSRSRAVRAQSVR